MTPTTTSDPAAPDAGTRETPVFTSAHVGSDEVRVWTSGPHVCVYARSPGAEATVSLNRTDAWRIATAMVPEIERFRTEHRDAMKAIHELKVEHRSNAVEVLKVVADEIGCDSGCEHSFYDGSCNATECSKHENGGFCGWMMAASLRDLAEGLEIRSALALATAPTPSDAGRDHPMPTAVETEAYNDRWAQEREDRVAGGDANRAGRDRGANPFVGTPARHIMWEQGWDSVERDKAKNVHVLLKCIDCGAKSYSTRERVDRYLRPGCTLITCPKCDGGRVEEAADAGRDQGEAGK